MRNELNDMHVETVAEFMESAKRCLAKGGRVKLLDENRVVFEIPVLALGSTTEATIWVKLSDDSDALETFLENMQDTMIDIQTITFRKMLEIETRILSLAEDEEEE